MENNVNDEQRASASPDASQAGEALDAKIEAADQKKRHISKWAKDFKMPPISATRASLPALPDTIPIEDKLRIEKVRNRGKGRPAKDFPMVIKAAVATLKQIGQTNREIAAQLNLTEKQVQKLSFGSRTVDSKDMEVMTGQFASEIGQIVQNLLTKASDPDFIDSVDGVKLVTSVAILVDKLLLLKGKPTAITETRGAVEEGIEQLERLKQMESDLIKSIGLPRPRDN